jgi:iron complex outermembrane receptor protein
MTPTTQSQVPDFSAPGRKAAGLSASLLLALVAAPGAYAQAAATPTPAAPVSAEETIQLEVFEVNSLRSSALKAIEVKRENPQFVDSIVAEDIGKFPDNNLVESLQRLPGVQVTDYGRGNITGINIRGLPDVTTTLNGKNIFTAAGLSLSLQDVPVTLLKQTDVMKTRAASHIETGLAGVIDIQTFRPFDFSGSKVSLSAETTYQEQRDKFDPSLSALISNRWKIGSEGKIGALLNVSYLTTTYRDQSATPGAQVLFAKGAQPAPAWPEPYARIFPWAVAWPTGLDNGMPTAPGSRVPGTNVEYVLGRDAIFFNDSQGKTKRPAATFALQYAPNDKSEYTFDATYLGYRNENYSNLLFSFVDWWVDWTPATLDVTLYPGTNIIQRRGYIGNVYSFTSGDYGTGKTDSFQYSVAGKWKITPDFTLRSEVVYQDSEYTGTNYFSRAIRDVRNDVTVNFNAGGGVPMFRYLDVASTAGVNEGNVADPSTWALKDDGGVPEVWDQGFNDKGNAITLTEDGVLHVDWPFIKKLRLGLRYDVREASVSSRFAEGDRTAGAVRLDALNTQFPGLINVNSDFFDGRADIPTSWASFNGEYAHNNRDRLRSLYTWRTDSYWNLKEVFNIEETTTAVYLQVDDFNTKIGNHTLKGQFGVRFVDIQTELDFTDPARGASKKTFGEAGVSKFLPSASFSFDITRDLIARFGYGQTIRRPGFNDLNPLIIYTRDVTGIGYGTASGGNKDLKPTESRNYDLALEYYFAEGSMLHVAGFRREIDGLVVTTRRRVSYTDSVGPYDYILTQPSNASEGELEGFEIGGKYYPKNLPGFLQGFGVEGSYTRLKSSQNVPMTNDAGALIGVRETEFYLVSPESYSVTLAYERGPVSARASYAWRSPFHHHNEAPLFANPLAVYNDAEQSLTAQITYKLSKNLSLQLKGTNLTDDIQHSYYGENGSTVHNFGNWIVGRTITAGVRYSF